MIKLSDLGQVYIVCGKTDLRKGIDGLATLIKEQFDLDPLGIVPWSDHFDCHKTRIPKG